MAEIKKSDALYLLLDDPVALGHLLGFTKLEEIHNEWIKDMVLNEYDETLQSHRGSYKTTCVSIALAIICIVYPLDNTLFLRKTDSDVKEIIKQVQKILKSEIMQAIVQALYGTDLFLTVENSTELSTSLSIGNPKGTSQLVGSGIGSSITGKHYDRIFTDDIVNKEDRYSRAERERTKRSYDELQNIKNRGGKIFNTGTPWHKDDCFTKMPEPQKYDVYSTGLVSDEEIEALKNSMESSLFAANYELRHIASDDIIFDSPRVNEDRSLAEQGIAHVDASYGGSDGTAFTICHKIGDKYYIYGKLWHKHVDDCMDEIYQAMVDFNVYKISCEDNGDKGYLAKALRKFPIKVHKYHESMNKFFKITSYMKSEWKNVYFVEGTDEEYIEQICDYNEHAEHDDAPDSCSCCIRQLWGKSEPTASENLLLL